MLENVRSEKRYPVPDNTYLHLAANHETIGRILDISAGGVGFEYVQLWDSENDTPQESTLQASVLSSGKYLLKEASGRVAYCHALRSESSFAGCVPMFRCGVQFRQLTQTQRAQLQEILAVCEERSRTGARPSLMSFDFDAPRSSQNTTV